MKKILIITYYWPPSGGAGVQRWLKFAKYLPEFGYTPIILTVDEKQASYAQLDDSLLQEISPNLAIYKTKTFEPYNLYKRLSQKKEIPYGGFSNQKRLSLFEKISRVIRGNLFVPDPRRGWNSHAYRKALELIRSEKIDTVVTSGPPHSTHLIGKKLKENTGIRWITDFRDPWTDIYYYGQLYHSGMAAKYDSYLEKEVLRSADRIITVSEEVGKLLSQKIPGGEEKIQIIPNGYDEADFENIEPIADTHFTITYTGTISKSYRIEEFADAIAGLPDEVKSKLKIRFVGNVPEEIISHFHQKGLGPIIELVGYVPHNKAISYMRSASLLLMAIPDSPGNKGIVTGKFYEYLAAGRPILAIGPPGGAIDKMLQQCQAGQLFSYHETEKMRAFVLDRFNRDQQGNSWDEPLGIEKYSRRNLTGKLAENL